MDQVHLNTENQERLSPREEEKEGDEGGSPQKVEEKEEGVAMPQESPSKSAREDVQRTSNGGEKQQVEKEQADFDNFDQFEDAPNEPEEQHHSEPSVGQNEDSQIANERHHLQQQQPKSHQQEPQIKTGMEEVTNPNNPIVQEKEAKIEEPQPNAVNEPLPPPSEPQVKVEAPAEAPSPKKSIIAQPMPALPALSLVTSTSIIKQAEKERIQSTFSIFLKYNVEYQKTVSSYKLIVKNVRSELSNKQNAKKDIQASLINYFEAYIKVNKDFYEKSSKVQREQGLVSSTNKLANIKEELKQGFEVFFDVRKTLTDEMRKLQAYIISYTFKGLNEAFDTYHRQQSLEEKRQAQAISEFEDAEKSLMKLFIAIEKQFKKGMAGEKTKEDLFVSIVKFINQETQYRQHLVKYGKTLLQFKKTFIMGEKQLFASLQRILNEFKLQSRKVFAAKKEDFHFTQDYRGQIQAQSAFAQLCTITDVDYIKSVLELQGRKEFISLTDDHFAQYLQLPFFDKFVGNKKDLFKGAINKCFPLMVKNEELIHTISGNLVHFNRETDECKDKFNIRHLNAKVFAEGAVELDEVIKGIVFSDSRTVRLKMQSHDRAEQLICYLNEKDQWREGSK